MPVLIVIGGPNGSGKTTLSAYLVSKGRIKGSIINPDEIAAKLGSYSKHIQASKIALAQRKGNIVEGKDIAFETTFSGNSELRDIIDAKNKGYKLILYFVALQSSIDNIVRVEERHNKLGHPVDSEDILRRYEKSKSNLIENIKLFHTVYLFDNSGQNRSRVAIIEMGKLKWLNSKHRNHPYYKGLFETLSK